MHAPTTTTVALGRIALAALLDTSPTARIGPPSARHESGSRATRTMPVGPRFSALVASGVTAAGWLIERNKLQSRGLEKEARSAVRMKDFLVTGSVLASLAALAGEQALRREYPKGIPITSRGALAGRAPRKADRYRRYEKLAASVDRAFTAAAVGAAPFINFALFNDYRPHPVRSFFSL